jgi:hypothetical protein
MSIDASHAHIDPGAVVMSTLSADLRTLAAEAYTYLYPLVMMDVSRQQSINLPADTKPGFGPPNAFHHLREFPRADFRSVVRVNFDTLYSTAWLDLTRGPVQIDLPDTDDRYYTLPLYDMWTDVFASPGKRTTGTGAQSYVVVPRGWDGPLPDGITAIEAPTPYVWIIGRVQTNGPSDYEFVRGIQDGMSITPLDGDVRHDIDPDHDTDSDPLMVVTRMPPLDFFAYAADVLTRVPPHLTDFSVLQRIARIGIVPGRPFDASAFDSAEQEEIIAGAHAALMAMTAAIPTIGTAANGWTTFSDTTGVYGNKYFVRAVVALAGLGANPAEDAIYPLLVADADGEPVVGDNEYVLHFDADGLPPVAAFWSLTMYDAEGFQIPNELDRYALGDRDSLTYNDDGSLDLLLSPRNPGPGRESNWLPSKPGPIGAMLRLYAPDAEVIDRRWHPPVAQRR